MQCTLQFMVTYSVSCSVCFIILRRAVSLITQSSAVSFQKQSNSYVTSMIFLELVGIIENCTSSFIRSRENMLEIVLWSVQEIPISSSWSIIRFSVSYINKLTPHYSTHYISAILLNISNATKHLLKFSNCTVLNQRKF